VDIAALVTDGADVLENLRPKRREKTLGAADLDKGSAAVLILVIAPFLDRANRLKLSDIVSLFRWQRDAAQVGRLLGAWPALEQPTGSITGTCRRQKRN
jgi:hypothetical protein